MIIKFKIFEKLKLYSSNFDKYIMPDKSGWYIQYKNKSGDYSFIRVDKKPENIDDAENMLKNEFIDVAFVKFYTYISDDDIENWKLNITTKKYNI